MRRFLLILCFLSLPLPAQAWNATGHRLSAAIAWQQLSSASQRQVAAVLAAHPDYRRWVDKASATEAAAIFAEASTWPDDIRHDPRFFDERREAPTPAIPGLPDSARHQNWHYVDLAANGVPAAGELDRQIERLGQTLASATDDAEIAWALPWLLHLVGDIHQPLHVGRPGDAGGNSVEIENPFNKRRPFSSLHAYWDDLPGASGLRGKRLQRRTSELLTEHPAPIQGSVRLWRNESHQLLDTAYPPQAGSLLPVITAEFHQQARTTADRRIVAAGYRLGRLLEKLFTRRLARQAP